MQYIRFLNCLILTNIASIAILRQSKPICSGFAKAKHYYAYNELRYKELTMTNPEAAERLMKHAQALVNLKLGKYEELATKKASDFVPIG